MSRFTPMQAYLKSFVAVLLLASGALFALSLGPAHASPDSKPLHFYLHYRSDPPSVGGVSTNYIMDTDRTFQDFKNSDFKRVGQPKIQIDWYLYPNFAGPVTFSGQWQVIIFANASALHPSGWNLEFWEKTPTGAVVWDSGVLSPDVRGGPSGNEGFVDVPVFGYTLSADLSHTLSPGNTLEVEVTVNTGSTVSLSVWYDSPLYPSQAIFPASDFAKPVSITTFDVNGTAREVFFTFWSEDQHRVVVRANVTDPFGGYDIYLVSVSIFDAANRTVVANQSMDRIAGDRFSFVNLYEATWPYPADALQGKYRIEVTVIDNNGRYNFEATGTYEPYVEALSQSFSIGIEFPVRFLVEDSHGAPLAGADVIVYSGGVAVASGRTDRAGQLELTVFSGPLDVHVMWHGTVVADQPLIVSDAGDFTITTRVYYPEFRFVSNAGAPIHGAMVFVTAPNGSNLRMPFLTDAEGMLNFTQHPGGPYGLLTFWQGVLVADARVEVTTDGPFMVRTAIYALTVNVTDNARTPLEGVQVVVASPTGQVFDFDLTDTNGTVSFNLPLGDYRVTTFYTGSYWLNYLVNTTRLNLPVSGDGVVLVALNNIPPPIYTTVGFWLIVAPVLVVVAVVVVWRMRRRGAPSPAGAERTVVHPASPSRAFVEAG